MNPTRKAIDKATRHLNRETRFADPAWTRDRDQAHILTQQEFFGGSYFLLSPHKPGPLHRNIGRAGLYQLNWLFREAIAYRCKFACEISGRDVAFIGLFCQAPPDSPRQGSAGAVASHSAPLGSFPENGYECLCCASSRN